METGQFQITQTDMRKLLSAADADAALMYLYLLSGGSPEQAAAALNISQSRVAPAIAVLRQLGLWQQDRKQFVPGQRPAYTEKDVLSAMDTDRDFCALYDDIQRRLGKALNTEEMKIILGFVRYLGLAPDVVCLLVSYCKDRALKRGGIRNPSLRTIEKEAYFWAEQGIDTLEEAVAYIRRQDQRHSQLGQLMQALQIRGRSLTASEEKYANRWLDMGMQPDAIAVAYDRTCLRTGSMNWSYMNTILTRWHEAGIHTAAQAKEKDTKSAVPKGASGQLGAAELDAIKKVLQED